MGISAASREIFLEKSDTTKNLCAFGMYLGPKFRKGRIPGSVIGKEQATGLNIRKGSAIFPEHVIISVKAVVNEDVDGTELLQKLRKQCDRIADVKGPSGLEPIGNDPAGRLARRKIARIADVDRVQDTLAVFLKCEK